jgi:hypothetical protein
MKGHARYAWYVVRHRWFVLIECWRLGIVWLGIIHDWSKLRPSEWFPYRHHFFGGDGQPQGKTRDKTGYYKPYDTGDPAFDFAWFLHQKRNKHHWQYWVQPLDTQGTTLLPMPDKYRREMFADWHGAARAQGKGRKSVRRWYAVNKHKIRLHPETRRWVEVVIRQVAG